MPTRRTAVQMPTHYQSREQSNFSDDPARITLQYLSDAAGAAGASAGGTDEDEASVVGVLGFAGGSAAFGAGLAYLKNNNVIKCNIDLFLRAMYGSDLAV